MPFFEIPVALMSLSGIWSLLSPLLTDAGKEAFKERIKGLLAKPTSQEQARRAVFGLLAELESFRKTLEEFVYWLDENGRPGAASQKITNKIEGLAKGIRGVFLAYDEEAGRRRELEIMGGNQALRLANQELFQATRRGPFAYALEQFNEGIVGIERKIKLLGSERMLVYNPDLYHVLYTWRNAEIRFLARLPKMSKTEFETVRTEADRNLTVLTNAIEEFRRFIKAEIPFKESFPD